MYTLLTGGAGYIGAHVAAELAKRGKPFVIADNFSNSSADAIAALEQVIGKSVLFELADVCDRAALDSVFGKYDIADVVHLAGFKAVGGSVGVPLTYYRNNVGGTVTLLEAMAAHSVTRIVFSSSATVYSVTEPPPWTEDTPTGTCAHPYGKTKFVNEEIIRDVCVSDNAFSAVILRYFNPVGAIDPTLRDKTIANVVPYIDEVAQGKRPHLGVFGGDWDTPDGTCVRDYLHVADLAAAHVSALDYAKGRNGSETFNLGTGKGVSVLELVRAYERANGKAIPYQIAPRRPGDIAAYWCDPSKAQRVLSWTATHSLDEMMRV